MQHGGLIETRADGALVLGRHPAEVERGRKHVADACRDYDGDLACTAMLLASELITNALEHGSGVITVLVSLTPSQVRVDVADESPLHPTSRAADPDDENGRGLLIVEHLASAWGMQLLEHGGKSVWFTLDGSAGPRRPRRSAGPRSGCTT